MGARHGDTAHWFAVRVWSNLCICCPGVVKLVRSNLGTSFPLFHVRDTVLHSEDYQTRPTCLHLTKVVCLGNLSRHFYGWHCCTSLYWHQPRCTSLFYAAPHAALFRAATCAVDMWYEMCDVFRLLCCCHLLGRPSHQFMMSIND